MVMNIAELTRRAEIGTPAAVNLAAFGSAFGSLVAAVRGICNLNGLSRSRHVLFGLEFSAVRMKEHDA